MVTPDREPGVSAGSSSAVGTAAAGTADTADTAGTGTADAAAAIELARASEALEDATPQAILTYAAERWDRVAISTAFGVEGCALIHMTTTLPAAVRSRLRVFTVDTGFLFEETRALARRFTDELGVTVETFEPALTVDEQARRHGPALYRADPDRCCAMRKVEPTERALAGLDCWIAGLRRDQASTRSRISILESYDRPGGGALVKVHPLARWTRSDTWRYVLDHGVPYNPLLDQGYKSIGCWPCTQPVGDGDGERAGRWGGTKTECGIHTFLPRAT